MSQQSRFRVVFFGTPEFAVPTLAALIDGPDDVVGLVCQADRPAGRGQKLRMPPTKELALEHGIAVEQPTKVRNQAFEDLLRGWAPDVIVVVAYGRILPSNILSLPPRGCINVHASLLPKYRGAAPIQWAIARGERETGVTIMQMNEEMDAGAIIKQSATEIGADETAGELAQRLAKIGADTLMETLAELAAGTVKAVEQDHAAMTLAPLIDKSDGEIDWTRPASEIERLCRGFHPWPSAFSYIDGKRLKIFAARPTSTTSSAEPGTIVAIGDSIDVATGDGMLAISELQIEGRKRLAARDLARGGLLQEGARLGRRQG